jgi:hypothetical protein
MGRFPAKKSTSKPPQRQMRMNWDGEHGDYVIGLFVDNYTNCRKNKSSTTRQWAKKLAKHESFKRMNITDKQVKNLEVGLR